MLGGDTITQSSSSYVIADLLNESLFRIILLLKLNFTKLLKIKKKNSQLYLF